MREYLWEAVAVFATVRPALDAPTVAALQAGLVRHCERGFVLGANAADTDRTSGRYFASALADKHLGTDYLSRPSPGAGKPPMGGLTATAADSTTCRNLIRRYCEEAAGGWWTTGSEYGPNEAVAVVAGAIAVGIADFPDVAAFAAAAADAPGWDEWPGGAYVQFADDQSPRNTYYQRRINWYCVLAAGSGSDLPLPAAARLLVGRTLRSGLQFGWRAVGLLDPARLDAAPAYAAPAGLVVKGGHVRYADAARGVLVVCYLPARLNIHHEPLYGSDVRAWAGGPGGAYALDHPIGYGFNPNDARSTNGAAVWGMSSPEYRGITSAAAVGGGFQLTGETSGWSYNQKIPKAVSSCGYTTTIRYEDGLLTRTYAFTAPDNSDPGPFFRPTTYDRVTYLARKGRCQVTTHFLTAPAEGPAGTWTAGTQVVTVTGHTAAVVELATSAGMYASEQLGYRLVCWSNGPTPTIAVVQRVAPA